MRNKKNDARRMTYGRILTPRRILVRMRIEPLVFPLCTAVRQSRWGARFLARQPTTVIAFAPAFTSGGKMKRLTALLCLLVCVSFSAYAQVNATVTGTVVDASAALVPGVSVTAQNTATGITTNRVTNESGSYDFPSLQPGTYVLTCLLYTSDA